MPLFLELLEHAVDFSVFRHKRKGAWDAPLKTGMEEDVFHDINLAGDGIT
jgi:hypothetical protein